MLIFHCRIYNLPLSSLNSLLPLFSSIIHLLSVLFPTSPTSPPVLSPNTFSLPSVLSLASIFFSSCSLFSLSPPILFLHSLLSLQPFTPPLLFLPLQTSTLFSLSNLSLLSPFSFYLSPIFLNFSPFFFTR